MERANKYKKDALWPEKQTGGGMSVRVRYKSGQVWVLPGRQGRQDLEPLRRGDEGVVPYGALRP